MDHTEDVVGSALPPKPPKPSKERDAERTKRVLLSVIAVAALATAAFTGYTAWETRQERIQNKALYCSSYAYDWDSGDLATYDDLEESQQVVVDALSCDLADD